MSDYLYFFNCSHLEMELFEGEFETLFKQKHLEDHLVTDIFVPVDNSVYIKDVIEILGRNNDFDNLLAGIRKQKIRYEDYKVVYLKNKESHVDYHQSLALARQVGLAIDGKVNMNNPRTTIAITYLDGEYFVGQLFHGQESWKKFANKPHTFCNALDLRMCKTLINLAVGTNKDLKVVDPCCGMGAVVLEGLNQGIDIVGYDISRTNSYKARLNLEHFGYDGQLIARMAIADLNVKKDVAIIDLPYNLYTPITEAQQKNIILSGLRLAPKLILVAHDEYDEWFIQNGISVRRKMTVKKFDNGKFARIVYILGR